MDPLNSGSMYSANLNAQEIDIDIKCLKREELPDKVRPKDSKPKQRIIPAPSLSQSF